MIRSKCPGQDTRYWTSADIHEQPCPYCGGAVEFWKTDLRVSCPHCQQKVVNPRFNLGCAEWCAYAEQCLGSAARGIAPQTLRLVLEQELSRMAHGLPLQLKNLKEKLIEVEGQCRDLKKDPLPVLIELVARGAAEMGRLNNPERYFTDLVETHRFPAEAVEEAKRAFDAK